MVVTRDPREGAEQSRDKKTCSGEKGRRTARGKYSGRQEKGPAGKWANHAGILGDVREPEELHKSRSGGKRRSGVEGSNLWLD